jgi:hypothetical protein
MKSGVIPALLQLCDDINYNDWEISRNAALAISIASYEDSNQRDMLGTFEFELVNWSINMTLFVKILRNVFARYFNYVRMVTMK